MPVTISASSLRDCRRALAYTRNHEPHSDNPPTSESRQAARQLNQALNEVVLTTMREQGWTFVQTHVPAASDTFLDGDTVVHDTVHAIGSHPQWTGDENSVIMVQARSAASIRSIQTYNPITASLATEARLAFIHQAADLPVPTNPENPAVLATLNLDTRQLQIEFMHPHQSRDVNAKSQTWLDQHTGGGLPAPDYSAGSWQCTYCPFLTTCHGPQDTVSVDDLDDDVVASLEETCDEYLQAHADARAGAAALKMRDQLRDRIKASMIAQNLEQFSYEGDQRVSVKITRTSPVSVDHDALKRFLTPDQYREAVRAGNSTRINISVK